MENTINTANYPLSVVVPLCNEAENIFPQYEEVSRVGLRTWEIIFVDDGSTDATWEQLKSLRRLHDNVQIVKHDGNYGQSIALITGIAKAKHPWIVTLDGDGQNDPADITKLIQIHQAQSQSEPDKHHVILGNRLRRQDHIIRLISTKIARFIRKTCLQDDCPDSGCAIKLFHRDDFKRLPQFKNMHRFLPILFKRDGCQLHNVTVNHRPREFGLTKYGVLNRLFAGIFDLIGVYWLICRPNKAKLDTSV